MFNKTLSIAQETQNSEIYMSIRQTCHTSNISVNIAGLQKKQKTIHKKYLL